MTSSSGKDYYLQVYVNKPPISQSEGVPVWASRG